MLRRRQLARRPPLRPRRRSDCRILLQTDVTVRKGGNRILQMAYYSCRQDRKRRGHDSDWSVYLDCDRVLHELSTEALRDGAVDLLLRLSATNARTISFSEQERAKKDSDK